MKVLGPKSGSLEVAVGAAADDADELVFV